LQREHAARTNSQLNTPVVKLDERRIDALFTDLDQSHLPGVLVGIAIHGRPVYRKGFGIASLELPVPLSPSIRCRIGSITKHFTCLTYLLLCEERLADIDDPVSKHLPHLHPTARAVTVRQLMANTSGLRDIYDLCFQFSGLAPLVTSDELIERYREIDDTNARPGATWNYNNGGFELLRAVIERITGEPLEDVMRKRLFGPIGMHNTVLHRSWDGDYVANRAAAHMVNTPGHYEKWTWAQFVGAGGILSTVDDMLRWMAHMDSPVVGSAATWELLRTPLTVAHGGSADYGLGLYAQNYRGMHVISHSGGGLGSNAHMMKVPEAGLDIFVAVNRGDLVSVFLAHDILEVCLDRLDPEIKAHASATGVFRSARTHRVIQLLDRDGSQSVAVNGAECAVKSLGSNTWQPLQPALLTWILRASGGDESRPQALNFDYCGEQDELLRVPSPSLNGGSVIAGRYCCTSARCEVTIAVTLTASRMRTTGEFGQLDYLLEPLGEGVWKARAVGMRSLPWLGGVLTFDDDNTLFHYSTQQTWALPFRRIV
jgi:CubicO group peptidase (beta-lactamase class C family)